MTMYFKITFDDGRRPAYGVHRRGSQRLAAETVRLAPGATHTNGIPLMLEADGWGDDNAFPGEAFETPAGFTIHCLSEEDYRRDTDQEDIPTHLLQ